MVSFLVTVSLFGCMCFMYVVVVVVVYVTCLEKFSLSYNIFYYTGCCLPPENFTIRNGSKGGTNFFLESPFFDTNQPTSILIFE